MQHQSNNPCNHVGTKKCEPQVTRPTPTDEGLGRLTAWLVESSSRLICSFETDVEARSIAVESTLCCRVSALISWVAKPSARLAHNFEALCVYMCACV
jgi:hypothetical protein